MASTQSYNPPPPGSMQEKIDDLSFLIGHTVTCLLTDGPTVFASSWLQDRWNRKPLASSAGFLETMKEELSSGKLKSWAIGEGLGDFVAIPATAAIQWAAPEAMNSIRKPLESLFGSIYEHSAEKGAKRWAEKHGVVEGSKEYQEHKQMHYDKEMRHLPQAFVWTAISIAAGIAAQKMIPSQYLDGNQSESFGKLLAISLGGKAITGLAANTPRVIAPDTTDKIEHAMHELTEHIVKRPTKNALNDIVKFDRVREKQELQHAAAT